MCLFVRNEILQFYDVSVINSSIEDILWVQFRNKISSNCVNICVCYLSPEGSSRMVDPIEYFDHLLSQIYIYQEDGPFIILGDFNARCGNDVDFIEGVDEIVHRDIIDFTKNKYGDYFLDFLINSNCIMLNGRSKKKNDCTSVSPKGLAVVDYAIVSHDCIHRCDSFEVIRAFDLFNTVGLEGCCDPDHNISDHSLLSLLFVLHDSGNIYQIMKLSC